NIILFIAVFLLFIIVVRKLVSAVITVVCVLGASALFPFILRTVFGIPVPLTISNLISFVVLGLVIYGVYVLISIVYTILTAAEVVAKIAAFPLKLLGRKKKEQ
ncbi:MAG: hypothetical protein HY832_02340, partial [Candidatus Aenigmarchaeota archaeon]|nr:hypothetical protein [Candidatus Aenigmarchaeota archaeon]